MDSGRVLEQFEGCILGEFWGSLEDEVWGNLEAGVSEAVLFLLWTQFPSPCFRILPQFGTARDRSDVEATGSI